MSNSDYQDIVIGKFCAMYDQNKGWAFPGRIYEKSYIRARELAQIYARKMKKAE